MPRAAAAIGRSWRSGRLSLPLPLPSLPVPPRFVGVFPYPLPHVDRHLSDSAALIRLSRRPYKSFLRPLPPHVGVGFRRTQLRAGVERVVAADSTQSRTLDESFSLASSFPDPSSSHSQLWRRPRCPPTRNG
eukprot:scaffold105480_cov45-Phaeocystis_antarctica.AAC.2